MFALFSCFVAWLCKILKKYFRLFDWMHCFYILLLVLKLKYKLFWFLFVFSRKKIWNACYVLLSLKIKKTYWTIICLITNCIRCNEFLATEKQTAVHDFLKHYDDGKSIPFEEKPLDIIRSPALTIYSIEFQKHSSFFNFYDS